MELFTQIMGWIGTILIISAYYLVSKGTLQGQGKIYQIMNLVASLCVAINVLYQKAWPALVLQLVCVGIAIMTLIKLKNK